MKNRNVSAAPDPKVIAQAVVTLVTFALTYFGIDLDPEVAGAISLVLGVLAGYVIRPAETIREAEVVVPTDMPPPDAGP
jgi:hypothetical protein